MKMTTKDLEEIINEIDAMIKEIEIMMGDEVLIDSQNAVVASA